MDRLLLEQNWNDGYPLCLETLKLLQDNVQIMEAILNGLNLPKHTIVRFPAINGLYFAYVNPGAIANVQNSLGRGEILRIGNGANLANEDISDYAITVNNFTITDSHENEYENVYQERRLSLISTNDHLGGLTVIDFSDLFDKALWKTLHLRSNNPYLGRENGQLYGGYVTGSPVIDVKCNERDLRIRIRLSVDQLPLAANSEFRIIFNGECFNNNGDVVPIWVCFNASNNSINKHVPASVGNYGNGYFVIKMDTHDLYEQGSVTTFTGQITVNAIIALAPVTGTSIIIDEIE